MDDTIPTGKIKRTLSSGKVVTRLGRSQLTYYLKKPFLSRERQAGYRREKEVQNARIIFEGLTLLRGTALKAAQMLSLESEVIPGSLRKELEKSYNQVPPINRALARKIIINNLNAPPEQIFDTFETKAFAAASLGQVHRAATREGDHLAVKIQYPDIAATISNDIRLLRGMLRPMSQYNIIKTALSEIETVLLNETDYEKEAANILFFKDHLSLNRVHVPAVFPEYSSRHVLSMSHMKGLPLNKWLETRPDQSSRNRIAQILHDIFVRGFYELKTLHADPNPGNFLITEDLHVGLLDFGCVRRFDDRFIQIYRDLIRISTGRDRDAYLDLLMRIRLVTPDFDPGAASELVDLFISIGDWFSRLFRETWFDFGAEPDFMAQGRQIGMEMHKFRKHIQTITPEFIFLDRTRYGLMRLFERMKAKIRIRNRYEHPGTG